jgi:signal transduction histidine kinase/ActR/RegA family two-component response regulator/HPt (histidine-containing phosphotransfer) domain-containing protein
MTWPGVVPFACVSQGVPWLRRDTLSARDLLDRLSPRGTWPILAKLAGLSAVLRKSTDPLPNEPSVTEALEVESAKRAGKGAWIYPIIACIVVLSSDLLVSHPFISAFFVAAQTATAWARLGWSKRALARDGKDAHRILRLAIAAQSGLWGGFVATIFYYYRFGSLAWFALTLSAGFVAGGTSSLGIHRQLHQLFMASMGLPIVIGMLAVEWHTGLTLAVAASIIVYCGFLLRDATHQVESYQEVWRAQEELRVARDQARAADRAKSSFLTMMSHEIRTPMHAAVGSASMLLETELDAEQRRYAHTIVHAGETLVGLINDILDLSRMQEHGLELECDDFGLHQALSETMQMFEPLAKRAGLDFELNAHRSAQRLVYGDKRRLQQILVNLIGNAIKFTERGFVRVDANTKQQAGTVVVRLSVQDSGIGIAQEQLDRIFLPFEQADFGVARKYGGSGLGLAICHRLAAAMQGRIDVTSAPEKGTRFDVELKLMAAQARVDSREPPQLQPEVLSLSSQLRVLVVDDSALNRAVAKQMLERLGCEAVLCESGEAALRTFNLESFDIVLMDCQMRGLDGYATTRRLRKLSKMLSTVPVIAVTANAFEDDRKAALEAGMNDLLAKPFGLHDLERLLIRWTRAVREPSLRPKGPSRVPDPGARLVHSATSMYPRALHNIAQLLGVEMESPALDGPVSGFLGQWEQRSQQMRAAIAAGDATSLRQVVHALEGGIPYLGSEQLNLALKELQVHSRAGDMREADKASQQLSVLVDELARSREKHLSQKLPQFLQ